MKQVERVKLELKNHMTQAGIYLRKPKFDDLKEQKLHNRDRNRWIKIRKTLEQRVAMLSAPNAERSLLGMKRDLDRKIEIIDKRWEEHGNHYLVKGIAFADTEARKTHHHKQYDYKKLLKQRLEVEFLLED